MAYPKKGPPVTRELHITGMVQGVGMRPFLALLAEEYGVTGEVCNVGSNVLMTVTATADVLDRFQQAIPARAPKESEITGITARPLPAQHFDRFTIIKSAEGTVDRLAADFPVCENCAKELLDKENRRFRHPFISCAVCGPRYSILRRAPYDRHTTAMDEFPMCPECRAEYENPRDRRFHAQTISCPQCGPQLLWTPRAGEALEREDALAAAIATLKAGGIVAVKGIGGYHLACDPNQENSVRQLRLLKGREQKPFAVLFADMERLKQYCVADEEEAKLLASPARPIVLLRNEKGEAFAPSVGGGTLLTGAFLPYTPVQILLLAELGELVMTSANRSGQPEIHDDGEMLSWLSDGRLDGVLWHRRAIVTRLDDSVTRIVAGGVQMSRRARGYAPLPLAIQQGEQTVLAYGSDLKSAFCLAQNGRAYMSQYFGDMEEAAVARAYRQNLEHMTGLFSARPTVAVCDKHPGYHTSLLARQSGLPLIAVQHHHAHIASVMAEHNLTGPVLGVAFDGTGYGDDGAVWGGEFLLCEGADVERVAHMLPVTLTGGDLVAKDGRLAALCYCAGAGLPAPAFEGSALAAAALAAQVNTVTYTGLGRLFDAASALLGICGQNGYEGQCAILLEQAATVAAEAGASPLYMDFAIDTVHATMQLDWRPVIASLTSFPTLPKDRPKAALGFHRALVRAVLAVCRRVRAERGVGQVALSGGVFQNALLLTEVTKTLQAEGLAVFTNHDVPVNDGGLALGQAWVALHRAN